jgi:hypothetical protein
VFTRLVAALLVVLPISAAQAQWYGGGYGYHSSTLEEGVQRGYADVVRSYGMANLLNSQAAGQFEDARKTYIENQLKATQTYFEMRRYNTEARRAERGTPLSTEQYVRIAREQAPEQLTATQLDPLTGMVNWPVALRQPAYEEFRHRIDRLFQDRASGYSVYGAVQKACEELAARLKADVDKIPANDYVTAKKFLDSLAWAARGAQS